MENISKLIRKESLEKLYCILSDRGKVYAPVSNGTQVEFRYNPGFNEVIFDHIRSTLSVKNLVFPKIETLISYTNSKTESIVSAPDPDKIQEIVLWGSHPCDNSAFDALRSIFGQDPEDKFFSKRMEKLTVIGLSCYKSDEYCFCTSAGVTPDSTRGSDILLTKLKGEDYRADILTEKGHQIFLSNQGLFEPLGKEETLVAEVLKKFSYEEVTLKLKANFEHPFWIENSLRCLGCGACAYVCPACACFDIQDEVKGKDGIRYRCWDSCGFGLFTLHTSGHNPRHVQSQRWRQRIMHKFSYMPENNNSLGCVGCGRCSSGCPVDMNIAEQLETIQNL